ncbi:MAG: radical SAM protein [Planctomycetes bacterium]|nr:radical SAM protein [Planctomycetota bacterium]
MTAPAAPPPSVAVVLLQPQCNMTCTFCVTEDGFDPMPFDEAVALLDHLVRAGTSSVVLGGGEPFHWPGDVVRLARAARERGLAVQVGTNGVDLPAGFAELDCFDRWVLPLESVDPGPHQAMRRFEHRHHAVILERLAELQRARRSVTLSTVLTKVNVGSVQDVAHFLRDYHAVVENVHAWHLYQFLPLGRGGAKHGTELAIPEADYRAAVAAVKQLTLPFRVFQRTDMYRSKTVEFYWRAQGRFVAGGEPLELRGQEHTGSRSASE